MSDLPDVPALRVFEPAPNGLAVLRTRLDVRRRSWWLLAVPALAVAIAILLLRTRTAEPPPPLTALPDPRIGENFYWVASQPRAPAPPPPPIAIVTTVTIGELTPITFLSP